MNKTFKFLSVTALLSVVAFDATARTTPTFVARSQGFDGPRQNAGTVGHTGLYGMDEFYGTLSVTPFYSRSFRSKDIAECLFGTLLDEGDCKGKTIKVEGSTVPDRNNTTSWVADYFYLPQDFESTLTFDPVIQNAGVDLQFWMGLDEWCNGLYFSLYAPVVWTKWDLGFKEDVTVPGSATVPPGVISPIILERTALLKDFATYAGGTVPADIVQNPVPGGDTSTNITIKRQGLQKAKICPNSDTSKVAVADLRAKLGWNFYNEEDWHIGFNIQAAAPTGNKRKAEFAFQPVVGNGNKWELGGGLSAHYTFWRSEDEEKSFGLHIDGNVTHLFKSKEERTFDLNNKDASRYMLAQKITGDVKFGLAGPNGTPTATAQFANEFAPIANLTTFDVDVSIGAQGNVNAWFNYTTGGLGWDFGYNFYGRSCEKIKIDDKCTNPGIDGTWVLRGTGALLFGYADETSGNLTADTAVPLVFSQSNATLTNSAVTIDALQLATAAGVNNDGTPAARVNLNQSPADNAPQSQFSQPVKAITQPTNCDNLNQGDLDLSGTRNMTHTVWTNLQWTWDREGWVPYLGLGGSVEFARNKHEKACPTTTPTSSNSCPKSDCLDCGLSQWQIWLKAGISFN